MEQNFGFGNPTDVKFTPLMKTRINMLVGIMLSQDIDLEVTAIDKNTLDKIAEDKKEHTKAFNNRLINESLVSTKTGKDFESDVLAKLNNFESEEFISRYQSDAQHLVNFFENSSLYNLKYIKEQLYTNAIIDGEFIFREVPVEHKVYPQIEVCQSQDVFFLKSKGSIDIKTTDAFVHRKLMSKRQVLIELGRFMNKKQKKDFLADMSIVTPRSENIELYHDEDRGLSYDSLSISTDLYNDYYKNMSDLVQTYYVEYKDVKEITKEPISFEDRLESIISGKKKKKELREFLYKGYRIGNDYYINVGVDNDAKRDNLNPRKVLFSFDGVSFNDSSEHPNSIGYDLIELQDVHDINMYHRDSLIANSGISGSRINAAGIPKFLGNTMMERLNKFIALKKQGVELYDLSQEGAQAFQHYGDFNNAVDGNSLSAIGAILAQINDHADLISGITPQMRGATEAREAASNVQTGVRMMSYANKKYSEALDSGLENVLLRLLENTNKAFPNGFSGIYNKGLNKVNFNSLPKYYSHSTFIVSIKRDYTDTIELEKSRAYIRELSGAGIIDPESGLLASIADSKQELHEIAKEAIAKKKKENDQLQKMGQQLEEASKVVEELQKANKDLNGKLEKSKIEYLDLEKRKVDVRELEVKGRITNETDKNADNKIVKLKQLDNDKDRISLEKEQLLRSSTAKEIRNS